MNDPFIKRAPTTSRQSALDSITSDGPMARTCHGTPKASLPNMRCLALSVPEIGGVRNLKSGSRDHAHAPLTGNSLYHMLLSTLRTKLEVSVLTRLR